MMQDIGGRDLRAVFLDSTDDSGKYIRRIACRVEKHEA